MCVLFCMLWRIMQFKNKTNLSGCYDLAFVLTVTDKLHQLKFWWNWNHYAFLVHWSNTSHFKHCSCWQILCSDFRVNLLFNPKCSDWFAFCWHNLNLNNSLCCRAIQFSGFTFSPESRKWANSNVLNEWIILCLMLNAQEDFV